MSEQANRHDVLLALPDLVRELGRPHGAVYQLVVSGRLVAQDELAEMPVFSLAQARRLLGDDHLITDAEAARRIGVALGDLRNIVMARRLRVYRRDQDGTLWIDAGDLDELRKPRTTMTRNDDDGGEAPRVA